MDSFTNILTAIISVLILFTLFKFVLKVSARVIRYILTNSISGVITLVALNYIGFDVDLNATNIIIVSLFGVPGLLGLFMF